MRIIRGISRRVMKSWVTSLWPKCHIMPTQELKSPVLFLCTVPAPTRSAVQLNLAFCVCFAPQRPLIDIPVIKQDQMVYRSKRITYQTGFQETKFQSLDGGSRRSGKRASFLTLNRCSYWESPSAYPSVQSDVEFYHVAHVGRWMWLEIAMAESPSFDCGKVKAGSIEETICKDDGLALLDCKLAEAYAAASQKAVNEHPPVLKAEQRGWIKGRNDCWKSSERRKCVEDNYRLRIAELQARYRLVPGTGPVFYACDGDPRKRGGRQLLPDRSTNTDRQARRQRLADVPAAER